MKWQIGRTVFRIHPLLLFICIVQVLSGSLFSLFPAFFALLIHEIGHLSAAHILHIPVTEINVGLFGGVMLFQNQPVSKAKCCILSAAGPLFNLLGYVLSYAVLLHSKHFVPFWLDALRMNLLLFLINLLPVLPLDGGHIILALFNHSSVCQKSLSICGMVLGLLLIGLSFLFAFQKQLLLSPALCGCFLLYAASMERQTIYARIMHNTIWVKSRLQSSQPVQLRIFAVRADMPLLTAAESLPNSGMPHLYLYDSDTNHIVGEINAFQFSNALLTNANQTLYDAYTAHRDANRTTVAKTNKL